MAIKDVSEVLRKAINGVLDDETGKKSPSLPTTSQTSLKSVRAFPKLKKLQFSVKCVISSQNRPFMQKTILIHHRTLQSLKIVSTLYVR